jgi:hypothetical protein
MQSAYCLLSSSKFASSLRAVRSTPDLTPQPKPVFARDPTPERAGLGPTFERGYAGTPLVHRWSDTIALQLSTANGATEKIQSAIIHQPFRVISFSTFGDTAQTSLAGWGVYVSSGAAVTAGSDDRNARQLWRMTREGVAQQDFPGTFMDAPVGVGTIYRCVPTRFVLVVFNLTGAAINTWAVITVEFLAPAP